MQPYLGEVTGLVGALTDRTNRWGRDGCASGPRRTLEGVVVRCDREELRALPGGSVRRRTRARRTKATSSRPRPTSA